MVGHQQDRAAVDATRKEDADRFFAVDLIEPGVDLVGQGGDVGLADLVEVGSPAVAFGGEVSAVDRVGVRATEQGQFGDVVGRDHAGVGGMELAAEAFAVEEGGDFVDAFGDDQAGAFGPLGEKVAHRPADRAGHADRLAVPVQQGELAVDFADAFRIAGRQAGESVIDGHIEEDVAGGIEQIDDSFDVRVMLHDECPDAGRKISTPLR